MKNLVIIISHCPTQEKQNILKLQLEKLNSSKLDILLYSHILLPEDIVGLSKYFIYDYTNPLLHWPSRGLLKEEWYIYNNLKHTLRAIWPDHGYTVFNQIIRSTNYALSLDYTHYTFINYDLSLTSNILKEIKSPTSDFLTSTVYEQNHSPKFPGLLFNILSKENLKIITPVINKEIYQIGVTLRNTDLKEIIYKDFKDAEDYWNYLISNFRYDIFKEPTEGLIAHDNKLDFLENKYPFKIFSSYNHYPDLDLKDQTENGPVGLLVYDNYDNYNISINIDSKEFKISEKIKFISFEKFNTISLKFKDEVIDLTPHLQKHIIKRIRVTKI